MIRHDGVKECDCCSWEVDTLYWYQDSQYCEDCWIDKALAEAEEVEDES